MLILLFAAYGFATAVQLSRGPYLNFKPFNCKFCLSFWFSLFVIFVFYTTGTLRDAAIYSIIHAFAIAGGVAVIKVVEDKLTVFVPPPLAPPVDFEK